MTEAGSGDIPLRWDVFMESDIHCNLRPSSRFETTGDVSGDGTNLL